MTSSSVRYCFPAKLFFYFGEQKIDGAKSGEYGGLSNSSKPQSHTAAIATTDLFAGTLSWWNRTPLIIFLIHSRNVSNATFQSPELLIQCGFIWKETMQLVAGNIEFNVCQVSLLWHNSFLVNLGTFQPTLQRQPVSVCKGCSCLRGFFREGGRRGTLNGQM